VEGGVVMVTAPDRRTDAVVGLPMSDTRDFEDADRGFIGRLEPCVVLEAPDPNFAIVTP
jgi:alkyl sulfatase BDS1-like metallo-beta-lactamase superfamily hydrolase